MILANAQVEVRQLLNQNDTSDTQFSQTMLQRLLDEGRRRFASILPEELIPKLRKSASLTVTAGIGTYPTDFFKPLLDPYVTVQGIVAKRIPFHEDWRLRFLEFNVLTASSTTTKYYREINNGIALYPTSSTACVYEYIAKPTALTTTDIIDLPAFIDDLVVKYVFRKCMGTPVGDIELANLLLKEEQLEIKNIRPT